MTVRVAPAAFGGAVAVPSAAVDRLKLASGDALKVLLFVCRHMDRPLTAEELADGTGLSPAAVADGAAYWEALGVLTTGEGSSVPFPAPAAETPAPAPAPAAPKAPEKAVVVEKPNLPSYDMICKRVAESDEVRVLFSEAQGKLGRTIGTADQSRLLMLLDYYGLPVEVILTVCEYARAHKQTTAQIYSMGIDWAKREIDTLEAADEELKRLESVNALWFAFAERTGIRLPKLSAAQRKYFATWKTDWRFSDEMITLAFDEMKKNTDAVSFPYMNKILSGWKQAGYDTPEKVARHEQERAAELDRKAAEQRTPYREKAAPAPGSTEISYDLAEAMRRMDTAVPTLKKKEDRK